jgi:hypothetical protein
MRSLLQVEQRVVLTLDQEGRDLDPVQVVPDGDPVGQGVGLGRRISEGVQGGLRLARLEDEVGAADVACGVDAGALDAGSDADAEEQ